MLGDRLLRPAMVAVAKKNSKKMRKIDDKKEHRLVDRKKTPIYKLIINN